MARFSWLRLGFLLVLAGCGPAISSGLRQEAGPPVSFAELKAHPEKYQGQVKVLGGQVIQVQPLGAGSLLFVDQRDLDSHLYPSGTASGGIFLVESDKWLNPNTYLPRSTVTVAGVVAPSQKGSVRLQARQIHYWEGPRWEKWYHPVPPEWYDYNPAMEYWYTLPYFSPWRGGW